MVRGRSITAATEEFSEINETNETMLVASLSREGDLVKHFVQC